MPRILIMRHAKSSWAVPGASDFERELNERGTKDLGKLSAALKERKLSADRIYCSPAMRTRKTLEGIKSALPDAKIEFPDEMYSGGMSDYMNIVNAIPGNATAMLIGHNPMCGAIASALAGSGNDEDLHQLAFKFPTGAIAVLDFDTDNWSSVERGTGKLVDLLLPRKL